MNATWQVRVYERELLVHATDVTGPMMLGRQVAPDERLHSQARGLGWMRLAVAPIDSNAVSPRHALIEPQPTGTFRVSNHSPDRPIGVAGGAAIGPAESREVPAHSSLAFGEVTVVLMASAGPQLSLHGLPDATLPPGQGLLGSRSFPGLGLGVAHATTFDVRTLGAWLHAAVDILQIAATSGDFFDKAARAVVDLVKLESGCVVMLRQGAWKIEAQFASIRSSHGGGRVSQQILERVRQEKRTLWEVPADAKSHSMIDMTAVVASPILNREGAVIGALYGDRRAGAGAAGPITEIEGIFVQLLARGVAAGLARLEQEQAALAARVQFEQFFTPELSRQLERQPDLLKGRDIEVTVLFCDVRGFSSISERLAPDATMEWMGDVMSELSECVRRHSGVVVDYIGDEILAMWGAPETQPDHAELACRAALDMLDCEARLDARWEARIGSPTAFGIGVNTGLARVGNTGSRQKFKYGPLGNTVNLASRVQGATKHFRCRLLVTGATRAKLGGGFATRHLGRVRVVNIVNPVPLFELSRAGWPGAADYEAALAEFEAGNLLEAVRLFGNWCGRHPDDHPASILFRRAVRSIGDGAECFERVWMLPEK